MKGFQDFFGAGFRLVRGLKHVNSQHLGLAQSSWRLEISFTRNFPTNLEQELWGCPAKFPENFGVQNFLKILGIIWQLLAVFVVPKFSGNFATRNASSRDYMKLQISRKFCNGPSIFSTKFLGNSRSRNRMWYIDRCRTNDLILCDALQFHFFFIIVYLIDILNSAVPNFSENFVCTKFPRNLTRDLKKSFQNFLENLGRTVPKFPRNFRSRVIS